jgi:hypothetical protein
LGVVVAYSYSSGFLMAPSNGKLTDLFELAGGYGGMKNDNPTPGSDGFDKSHLGPSGDMHGACKGRNAFLAMARNFRGWRAGCFDDRDDLLLRLA